MLRKLFGERCKIIRLPEKSVKDQKMFGMVAGDFAVEDFCHSELCENALCALWFSHPERSRRATTKNTQSYTKKRILGKVINRAFLPNVFLSSAIFMSIALFDSID